MPYYTAFCTRCSRQRDIVVNSYHSLNVAFDSGEKCLCGERFVVRTEIDLPASFGSKLSIACGTMDICDTPEAKQAIGCKGYNPHDNGKIGASTQLTNRDL